MPEIEPPRLTGGLIARKGVGGAASFVADDIIRTTSSPSASRRAFGPAGTIVSLLIVAAVSAYGGYRLGANSVDDQHEAGSEPASVSALPPPMPATLPGPDPVEPSFKPAVRAPAAGILAGLPPIVPQSEAAAALDKPVRTLAPAPDGTGGWIDISATLDRDVPLSAAKASAPVPPRKPSRRAALYRIQLSALTTQAAARREWRRLKRSHGRLLAGRDPIVVRGLPRGAGRPVWRLQLAALAERADAQSFCRQARERSLGCMVGTP